MFRRAKFRLLFFPSSSRIQLIELGKRARVEKTWNKRLCRRGGRKGDERKKNWKEREEKKWRSGETRVEQSGGGSRRRRRTKENRERV